MIELPKFKIKKIAKLTEKDAQVAKKELTKLEINRKELCQNIGITPRQFRRVLNQEQPTSYDVLESLNNYFVESGRQLLQVTPMVSHKHKDLIMPIFMTSQLSQIFGYFIGDGCFEERGLRFRDARIQVLESYQSLFKQVFNTNGRISKINHKNCYNLDINSREIRDFFELILSDIYNYVGKSGNEVVTGFIKGFVDAEGNINKKRAYISVSQKDNRVLRYIQLFMLRLGVRSTIKFSIGKKKINILRIIDKDVKDYLQIGFTAKDKQERLFECIRNNEKTYSYEMMPIRRKELRSLLEASGLDYSKFMKPRSSSYLWTSRKEVEKAFNALMECKISDRQNKQKIEFMLKLLKGEIKFEKIREIKIRDNTNKEKLFDFSVPHNENYVANGFIVHNSTYRMYLRRGKAGSRVAKLIDSPNLPDNEAQFFITEKGVRDVEQ